MLVAHVIQGPAGNSAVQQAAGDSVQAAEHATRLSSRRAAHRRVVAGASCCMTRTTE